MKEEKMKAKIVMIAVALVLGNSAIGTAIGMDNTEHHESKSHCEIDLKETISKLENSNETRYKLVNYADLPFVFERMDIVRVQNTKFSQYRPETSRMLWDTVDLVSNQTRVVLNPIAIEYLHTKYPLLYIELSRACGHPFHVEKMYVDQLKTCLDELAKEITSGSSFIPRLSPTALPQHIEKLEQILKKISDDVQLYAYRRTTNNVHIFEE
jgi:hypothetical protein